jgi:hypothetical protein
MSDVDPYAGVETEKEQQTIYQGLLKQYEQAEYARKREIHDSFGKDWQHYRDVQLKEDEQFYKYIAMFAAGAFGVSFAFIDQIVPFRTALHKPVIAAGWACLALALVINVLIHLVSARIHGWYTDRISENIQRAYDGNPQLGYKRWYGKWLMKALYILNFMGFLGGMACLVAFIFLNV